MPDLAAALRDSGLPADPGQWCAADLSLGTWTSNLPARRILEQLGEPLREPPAAQPFEPLPKASPEAAAELTGRLVDSESRGQMAIIAALELAARTADALSRSAIRTVLILAPRFNYKWRTGDLAYVRFLASALEGTKVNLVLVVGAESTIAEPSLAIDWLNAAPPLRSVPGVPAPLVLVPDTPDLSLARAAGLELLPPGGFVHLAAGRLLIDPALRQPLSPRLRRHFDLLASLAEAGPSLRAYARLHGSGYFSDIGLLAVQSWKCFGEGALEIALDLMAFAAASATGPAARQRLLYELQGMRIAALRFAEAAAIPDPDPSQPQEIRGGLLLTKGWGLALSGQPEKGEPYLAAGKAILKELIGNERQFLYVRNIHALSLARTGRWELAMAEEQAIENQLDREESNTGTRDWPITYVNALNQARLHKYRGDHARALDYYERAFETTLGARSESDSVYANFCMAKVHSDRGDANQSYVHWLRTGLHWASASAPEAIALRVSSGILGRPVSDSWQAVDEISELLEKEIRSVAEAAGRPRASLLEAPAFYRLNRRCREGGFAALVGESGWAVLIDPSKRAEPAVDTAPSRRLRNLLARLLLARAPAVLCTKAPAVALPCGLSEVPQTERAALLEAALSGTEEVFFEGRAVEISGALRRSLLERQQLALSDAVAWIVPAPQGARIGFKRHRDPILLNGIGARVALALDRPFSLAELRKSFGAELEEALDELEREDLLQRLAPIGEITRRAPRQSPAIERIVPRINAAPEGQKRFKR